MIKNINNISRILIIYLIQIIKRLYINDGSFYWFGVNTSPTKLLLREACLL